MVHANRKKAYSTLNYLLKIMTKLRHTNSLFYTNSFIVYIGYKICCNFDLLCSTEMWLKDWSLRFYHEEVCSNGGLLDHCVHTVKWSSANPNYSFFLSLSLGFDLHVFPSWCATLCKVTGTREQKPTLNQIWTNIFFSFSKLIICDIHYSNRK